MSIPERNKSMKIISVMSSARKSGNTERIAEQICEEIHNIANANNIRAEIEQLSLRDTEIKLCKGCRICFDRGEEQCPLKDDFLAVRDKISQADGIILASPVYVEDVNGIMKNWIDRMSYNCHRPAFTGKTALILTTSGGGSTSHALRTMKFALLSWGFYISAQFKFRTGALMEDTEMAACFDRQIKTAANRLFSDVNSNKPKTPSVYSLMIFKIQQKYRQKNKKEWNTFDYAYWKEKGWLENTCSYYIPHNASFIKVKFARLMGSIASKVFI